MNGLESMSHGELVELALKTLRSVVGENTSDQQAICYCTDILQVLDNRYSSLRELSQLGQELQPEDSEYHQESEVELGPQKPKPKVNYDGS